MCASLALRSSGTSSPTSVPNDTRWIKVGAKGSSAMDTAPLSPSHRMTLTGVCAPRTRPHASMVSVVPAAMLTVPATQALAAGGVHIGLGGRRAGVAGVPTAGTAGVPGIPRVAGVVPGVARGGRERPDVEADGVLAGGRQRVGRDQGDGAGPLGQARRQREAQRVVRAALLPDERDAVGALPGEDQLLQPGFRVADLRHEGQGGVRRDGRPVGRGASRGQPDAASCLEAAAFADRKITAGLRSGVVRGAGPRSGLAAEADAAASRPRQHPLRAALLEDGLEQVRVGARERVPRSHLDAVVGLAAAGATGLAGERRRRGEALAGRSVAPHAPARGGAGRRRMAKAAQHGAAWPAQPSPRATSAGHGVGGSGASPPRARFSSPARKAT